MEVAKDSEATVAPKKEVITGEGDQITLDEAAPSLEGTGAPSNETVSTNDEKLPAQMGEVQTVALKTKGDLEQRYIRLLELRIAQLEELVDVADDEMRSVTATGQTEESDEEGEEEERKPDQTRDADTKATKDDRENAETSEKAAAPPRLRDLTARWNDDDSAYEDEETEPAKSAQDIKAADDATDTDKAKTGDDAKDTDKAKSGTDKFEPTIFRRYMQEHNPKKVSYHEIEITSPELKRIYYAASFTAREETTSDSEPLTLTSPFTDFLWNWTEFEAACKPAEGDSEEKALAREDLKQLLGLVRQTQTDTYFKARDTYLPKGALPFEYLWTLFAPGTKVCAKTFLDDMHILEVRSCTTPPTGEIKGPGKELRVHCIGLDWDGNNFGPFEYTFVIKKNTEQSDKKEMQIDALEVYPLQYHSNQEGLRQDLLQRGERFWHMCRPEKYQHDYKGSILTVKQSQAARAQMLASRDADDDTTSTFSGMEETGGSGSSRKEYLGQVIVDAFSFLRAQDDVSASGPEPPLGEREVKPYTEYDCTCNACLRSPIIRWHKQSAGTTSALKNYTLFAQKDGKNGDVEHRLMMCPPRVLGYALKVKTWAQFRVTACTEISTEGDTRRNYFQNQLQLEEKYKQMLLAFVNSHQSSRHTDSATRQQDGESAIPKSLDVIEGKGKGLAILLHGPPGVGKTLTAETIALATGRPLLVVSVAEVGTKAANAESRLNIFFAIAARWGAILLIDEADVFLEERVRTDNPERNMLVSVLLRSLEYYEGIIFLTTNRIRSIDVAVQSRMHLAIQYKRLSQAQKAAIYRNLLDKIPDAFIKGDREIMYKDINKTLCRRNEMNGRQIRNIVSAALALAKERGRNGSTGDARLRISDLGKVHEATTDFLGSLKDTLNKARQRNEAAEEEDDDD